ncbi:MAG: type II secretion system protein [Candidatus Riflebacteria bacterium]|nr:type II secretion system protein [Candidatus Riflebacteria bacterium]
MKNNNSRAFTLVEIIVSTVVIASIMITLVSSLWLSSEIWRKGQQKNMLMNQMRTVHDLITRDISLAVDVSPYSSTDTSIAVITSATLSYDLKIIATLPSNTATTVSGTATFAISHNTDTRVLSRKWMTKSASITAAQKTELEKWFQFTLARDVATFVTTRSSSFTVSVNLGLESLGEDYAETISLEATDTYLCPGVKQ